MILRACAAVAFVALVALGVTTAAVRIASLRARVRIETLRLELRALDFEVSARVRALAAECALPRLRDALADELREHREE